MQPEDVYKLVECLKAKKETLETDGSSYQRLAAECSAELGCKVTVGTLKRMLPVAQVQMKSRRGGNSEALKSQLEDYRNLMLDIIQAGQFRQEYIDDIVTDEGVPEFVQDAFRQSQ